MYNYGRIGATADRLKMKEPGWLGRAPRRTNDLVYLDELLLAPEGDRGQAEGKQSHGARLRGCSGQRECRDQRAGVITIGPCERLQTGRTEQKHSVCEAEEEPRRSARNIENLRASGALAITDKEDLVEARRERGAEGRSIGIAGQCRRIRAGGYAGSIQEYAYQEKLTPDKLNR